MDTNLEEHAIEDSFDNGKEYSRQEIIRVLLSLKGVAFGSRRVILGEIIDVIKKIKL